MLHYSSKHLVALPNLTCGLLVKRVTGLFSEKSYQRYWGIDHNSKQIFVSKDPNFSKIDTTLTGGLVTKITESKQRAADDGTGFLHPFTLYANNNKFYRMHAYRQEERDIWVNAIVSTFNIKRPAGSKTMSTLCLAAAYSNKRQEIKHSNKKTP